MATIKSYSDISQSKKLADILPLESADMCYRIVAFNPNDAHEYQPYCFSGTLESDIPCWSLAALLNVVSEVSLNSFKDGDWNAMVQQNGKMIYSDANNSVDACYKMILKLHELNLL